MKLNSKLFVVSGPSASGKTSLMRTLMKNEIVSITTRLPRTGEVAGVDYHYISEEDFNKLLDGGQLAEYATYYGSASYGITKEELDSKLAKGDAFVIVEVEGFKQLKELYGDRVVSIFIYPDSVEEAIERMVNRGDKVESIEKRASTFAVELDNKLLYDYVVVNRKGKFYNTLSILRAIVAQEGDWEVYHR